MRFIVGFLVTIGLIVLIIVLLLRGSGAPVTSTKTINLVDYADNGTQAELILDGPIVADSEHKEIEIDVNSSQVTMTVYQGYNQTVVKDQSFANNQTAYAIFLRALQLNGFQLRSSDSASANDERGYCSAGSRYIYTFVNDGSNLFRSWSTSCGSQGTFRGVPDVVRTLFEEQVPNYDSLSSSNS